MTFESIINSLGSIPFFFGALIGLGFSIFVHELGHFLAAKHRGLRVTRFSIGMGPKLWSWEKDGVEYRLSVLPIGGYVALPQLADMGRLEGGNEEEGSELSNLPPISFLDKVIVAVMGAVFNFIFAFFLALILWWSGQPTTKSNLTTEVGYVSESLVIKGNTIPGPAYSAGLQAGDKVLEVDGSPVETFTDIQRGIWMGVGRNDAGAPETILKVLRNGETIDLTVNPAIAYINPSSQDPIRTIGFLPASEVKIHHVTPDSPAEAAGLQKGDIIVSANGIPVHHLRAFIDTISKRSAEKTTMEIMRDGEKTSLELYPKTIARTKPLVKITLGRSGKESEFSIRPDFSTPSTELKTELDSKSTLKVHQIISNESDNLGRLRHDDRIIAINNKAVTSLQDVIEEMTLQRGPVVHVTIGRGSSTQTIPIVFNTISTEIEPPITQPMVGFSTTREMIITHVGPFKQFGQQIDITFQTIRALFHRGSEIGIGHLSGPIGIVRQLTEITKIDLRWAIGFLILMNINLGILNLMPIPILDGGHILFATIEKIRRKSLPIRIVASLQGAFMILLFSLMAFVLFKDSVRWHGDNQSVSESELMGKLYIEPVFIETEKESE